MYVGMEGIAKRKYKKDRARRGILLLIKKNWRINKKEWKTGEMGKVLGIKMDREGGWLIILVYMGKERSRNFSVIEKWIEDEKDCNRR